MKYLFLIIILFNTEDSASAQTRARSLINVNLGYGTENNYGNTGFVFGVGYQKEVFKKIDLQTDLNYFTTNIYNAYSTESRKRFADEERFYNNAIFSEKLGYTVVGRIDKTNIRLEAGVSAFLYNYKILNSVTRIFRPDGSIEVVPGSISYYKDKGLRLAYTFGFDFNVRINENYQIVLTLDTYSGNIPLEFFIPSLSLKKFI